MADTMNDKKWETVIESLERAIEVLRGDLPNEEPCGKEFTLELMKIDTDRSLVVWVRPNKTKEFVVCSYYDANKKVGSQWSWGHYFFNLFDAVDYVKKILEESK